MAGPQTHGLIYGGSRSGKTFLTCYAIATRAIAAPGSRHVIFRRHGVAVRQAIGKDTFPRVMALAYPDVPLRLMEQDGYFKVGDAGAEVWLAGLEDKERVDKILGREYATIYFNEASEIPFNSYKTAGTRLAQAVERTNGEPLPLRSWVDLNPTVTTHWTYQLYVEGKYPDGQRVDLSDYWTAVANPNDNRDNLPASYIKQLENLPSAMRARFFEGVFGSDAPNALWRRADIRRAAVPAEMGRVVVAVDPAASSDAGSDETGIVAVGITGHGPDTLAYVLEDASGKFRPEEWARRAISLYDTWGADRIIGEANNGGEMVEAVIRAQRPNVSYKAVHASRGKVTRAEPSAAHYERGRVFHCGEFPELETQMCSFTSDFDRKAAGYSPDRVDALVWAMSELIPEMVKPNKPSPPPPLPQVAGLGSRRRF